MNEESLCPVTRGEVDLDAYASRDGVWREWKIAAPARRALVDAGIVSVDDLRRADFDELKSLHGMGPTTLVRLREGLASEE